MNAKEYTYTNSRSLASCSYCFIHCLMVNYMMNEYKLSCIGKNFMNMKVSPDKFQINYNDTLRLGPVHLLSIYQQLKKKKMILCWSLYLSFKKYWITMFACHLVKLMINSMFHNDTQVIHISNQCQQSWKVFPMVLNEKEWWNNFGLQHTKSILHYGHFTRTVWRPQSQHVKLLTCSLYLMMHDCSNKAAILLKCFLSVEDHNKTVKNGGKWLFHILLNVLMYGSYLFKLIFEN